MQRHTFSDKTTAGKKCLSHVEWWPPSYVHVETECDLIWKKGFVVISKDLKIGSS